MARRNVKAALANLTPQTPRRFAELMQLGQNPRMQLLGINMEFGYRMAVDYLAYTQDLRLVRVLIREIENFRPPAKKQDEWQTRISPAVDHLVEYPAKLSLPPLRKLFDQLKPSAKTMRHPFVSQWRVAHYLYNALPLGDRAFVKEAVGQAAAAELEALYWLRPIPQGTLAFDSKLAKHFE